MDLHPIHILDILSQPECIYDSRNTPNTDKPEIPNYKHQITNKFQITISKSQIRSGAN